MSESTTLYRAISTGRAGFTRASTQSFEAGTGPDEDDEVQRLVRIEYFVQDAAIQ